MFIKYIKLSFKEYIFELINEYFITLFVIVINLSFYIILIYNDFEQEI